MPNNLSRRQALVLPAGLALGTLAGRNALATEPVKIGLVAALSGASAKSGEGITRGLTIAIRSSIHQQIDSTASLNKRSNNRPPRTFSLWIAEKISGDFDL